MENRLKALARYAGFCGAALFASALIGFGAALQGYSQSQHPVALLGASGFPHAQVFNTLGFLLPGLLAGVVAISLRGSLPPRTAWPARIGAQLVCVSALAFIAMGLLPLDPADLENKVSSLHGTAWMLWSVAFIPGALLLSAALWNEPHWSGFARLGLCAATGQLVAGFLLPEVIPAGIAHRIAFGIWWVWLACAGLSRLR